MATEQIRRWESGALAHAVTDPFGQGPLPWLRGSENYFDIRPGRPLVRRSRGRPRATRASPPPHKHDGPRTADDVHRQIKGFASTGAVAPGEAIDFRVTVDPPQPFSVDVYRIGHYGGEGASKITTSPRLSGIVQPAAARRRPHRLLPPLVAVLAAAGPGVLESSARTWPCSPPRTATAATSPSPSATTTPPTCSCCCPTSPGRRTTSTPRTAAPAPASTTPGTSRARLLGEEDAATTVSFDRPYAGAGLPLHVGHAYDFIRWAERYGYDLAYADTRDLHAGRVDPTRYRGLVFPGHDEYWSVPMRRAVEARPRQRHLPGLPLRQHHVLAGRAVPVARPGRRTGCSPAASAAARAAGALAEIGRARTATAGHPVRGPGPRAAPAGRPQRRALAVGGHRRGRGRRAPGLVAGEADRYFPRTPLPDHTDRILLAHSPYADSAGARRHQETSLYRAPSGALVFASGTFAWSPALDRPGHVDQRVQRATANLLDRICKRD